MLRIYSYHFRAMETLLVHLCSVLHFLLEFIRMSVISDPAEPKTFGHQASILTKTSHR